METASFRRKAFVLVCVTLAFVAGQIAVGVLEWAMEPAPAAGVQLEPEPASTSAALSSREAQES